jgi:cell division protein ZapA
MSDSRQINAQIMGQTYVLAMPTGGEARLLEAIDKVDTAMCQIRDAGKVRARDRIAVLTALNFAYEMADQPAAASPMAMPPADPSDSASAPDDTLDQLLKKLDAALGDDGQLL